MSGDPYDEVLKTAEASLRDTVARLGNTHPDVYAMLCQYIALLKQCGRTEQADKLELRAKALKEVIEREQAEKAAKARAEEEAKEAARKAEEEAKAKAAAEAAKAAEAARAAEKAQEEALARAVMASQGAPQQTEADKKSELAKKAQKAKAAAEEGVFDLDMFDDEDEESLAMALELVKETPELVAPKAAEPAPVPAAAAAASDSDEPLFLFNSHGEHVAVAYNKALFSPQGENIGRLLEDYDVYLDRNGWYLGQVLEGNRLGRDVAWIHRHLNFGDRGNEGDRAGWGRIADVERTYFDRGFEDVKFGEDQ